MSQESSPITQWQEVAEHNLEALAVAAQRGDVGDSEIQATLTHLTSATIELIQKIIGDDEPGWNDTHDTDEERHCNKCESFCCHCELCDCCGNIANGRNVLRHQLRQSLKELKDNATKD